MTRQKNKQRTPRERELSRDELEGVATNFVTAALDRANATDQQEREHALWLSSSCFAVMVACCRNADAMADAIEQAVQATGNPRAARQALAVPMRYAVEQAKQRRAESNGGV